MIIFVLSNIFVVASFESDVEAEFIALIEYTAKICNKVVRLWGIFQVIMVSLVCYRGFRYKRNSNKISNNFKRTYHQKY